MKSARPINTEALAKAREASKAAREAALASGVPQRIKTWAERYAAKPKNLRLAIACHCHQCMGGEGVAGVREDIRGCTAKKCPLFPHRPYRMREEAT